MRLGENSPAMQAKSRQDRRGRADSAKSAWRSPFSELGRASHTIRNQLSIADGSRNKLLTAMYIGLAGFYKERFTTFTICEPPGVRAWYRQAYPELTNSNGARNAPPKLITAPLRPYDMHHCEVKEPRIECLNVEDAQVL